MIKCTFAGCNGDTCMGFCGTSTGEMPDLLDQRPRLEPTALNSQIGGAHYKELPIQPVEYIHKNNIPFIEGAVIKYVTRWRVKGGVKDLEKAKHFIDLLIELEGLNA